MARQHRWFVSIVALLFLIAACGGDDSTTAATATPPPPSTAQPDTTTTEAPSTSTTAASTTAASTTTAATTTSTTQSEPAATADVFFSSGDGTNCAQVEAFPRQIDPSADPIAAAFAELVAGPTADEAASGAGSFFSSATADAVQSVDLFEGLLMVDLNDYRLELANASTSCGSESFLGSLNATAFQFDEVESIRYQIFGSCNVFYEFLQRECQDQTRSGPIIVDLDTYASASGSGCRPGTDELPDGEWFGYVTDATGDAVEFDLACWFTGAAAADAAVEDGEESPPPNDYHIRNSSDELRTVAIGEAVDVTQLSTPGGGPDTTTVSYVDWADGWRDRVYQPGVWLTVIDGAVTAIVEQYQP